MQEVIDLTKDLIRFKTMHSKPQEIKRCAAFIESYLNILDIEYHRLDYENKPSFLVLPRSGFTPILLMSHIDVVDAPDELFNPMEKDRKLFGRGSLDDKYAVALSLVLLKKYLQRLRMHGRGQNDLPFGVLITSDEEIGGFQGAGKALQKIKADFCIVLDGGSIENAIVKEKGLARVKFISKGKAAHGARPWMGKNALEKLIDDFIALRTYFIKAAPVHEDRAVVITNMHCGKLHNGIPEYAEAFVEIRYSEIDDMEKIFERLQKAFHSEIDLEVIEPFFPGGESPHLHLLLDISKKTKIGFEDGANDARFLSKLGLKGIIWGADGDRSRHSEAEHVNIESVYELYRILDEFIKRSEVIR
jgi:succinyl-diaminopimelate desuccinylase